MTVHRNEATLARVRRTLGLIAAVGIVFGAVGLARGLAGQGVGATPWAGGGLLATGLVALALRRRARAVAVETDGEGLVVRNLFTTRRLAWADVDGFEEGRRRGFTLAAVRTRSGRRHALSAVGDPGPVARKILSALEAERSRCR
ncbi:hypothetical protein HRbin12_01135 [bacterium HR12]|nr:hypothetical protein HRbin12_01135 [bacterium HR12]